jgi:COP9 signalosome complex subunit 1
LFFSAFRNTCTDNYSQVHDYVAKAEHSVISGDLSFPVKLKAAAGLAYLAEGNFELAAKSLTIKGAVEDLGHLCAPEDVALYGALVGLATMSREVLQTFCGSPLMELAPKMKECLRLYCQAEYRGAISILVELHPILALDMLLAPHLTALLRDIRNKAMVEYLKPFNRVSLSVMADTFSVPLPELVTTLATLIGSGKIDHCRINCSSQTLEKDLSSNALLQTQEKIMALQDRVLNDSYACIIRLACLEFDQSVDRRRLQPHADAAGLDQPDDSSDDDQIMEQVVGNPDECY